MKLFLGSPVDIVTRLRAELRMNSVSIPSRDKKKISPPEFTDQLLLPFRLLSSGYIWVPFCGGEASVA
jgi:hypothetical protein